MSDPASGLVRRARPLRVLHCPAAVGGHPVALARAEQTLGMASHCLTYQQLYFQYPVDEVLWSDSDGQLRREIKCWSVLRRAMRDFDIVHFNFGSSIFPSYVSPADPRVASHPLLVRYGFAAYRRLVELLDVRLLRRLGKGIVVTYQGDDARLGDFCRASFEVHASDEVGEGYYLPIREKHKRRRLTRFGLLAHQVLALNPDLLHVLTSSARFMPYASVDLTDWQPIGPVTPAYQPPVVAHAPSHRGVKGTRFVLDAVERLRAEGVRFEFRLIENLSHAEARKAYESADLYVDQLLLGWYGGVAVELMSLAKPVVCYVRPGDLRYIPPQMAEEIPTIQATPETIYMVLRQQLTEERGTWAARGAAGRRYVERWHDPLDLARQTKAIYLKALGEAESV